MSNLAVVIAGKPTQVHGCDGSREVQMSDAGDNVLRQCAKDLRAAGFTCLADEIEFGALSAVEPTEPLFVLCGRDRLAPQAIKGWIDLARLSNVPDHKLESAHLAIEAFERWPGARHYPD